MKAWLDVDRFVRGIHLYLHKFHRVVLKCFKYVIKRYKEHETLRDHFMIPLDMA